MAIHAIYSFKQTNGMYKGKEKDSLTLTNLAGKRLKGLSFKDISISFFWPSSFFFWWDLRWSKQFSSTCTPQHPLYPTVFSPLMATVLQHSVAVGGPNTCNLAAGQILTQHPLSRNYINRWLVFPNFTFVFSSSATRTKTQFPCFGC